MSIRSRTAAFSAVASALVLLSSLPARGDCNNPLVSTCINSDTFWPHAGPTRFLSVGGTETVGASQVGFGLITSYQSQPIVLRIASPGPGGSDQYAIDDQVTGNFLWAYGVTDRLELDYALPVTFGQGGAGVSPITGGDALHDTATRDMRFGFTYSLIPRERADIATQNKDKSVYAVTTRLEMSAPTGDRDEFAGERTGVFMPSVAADYRRGQWFAGLEIGARVRPVTELAGARVGTQILGGLGVGYDILPKNELLSVTAEARALYNLPEQHDTVESETGLESTPNGKHIIPAEWMVSVRSAPFLAGDVSFQLGGGGTIPTGESAITTPRFRFVLGVTYAPLERDSDKDGVTDRVDKCPGDAQAKDSYPPRDGCTHREPPPAAPDAAPQMYVQPDATPSPPIPPSAVPPQGAPR